MPINTDLTTSPYFDDYDESKDFQKILFQPGVPVQVRELNQLQSILQRQIERFGDNILKRGTIIDGCDIVFHTSYPYVKVKDVSTDGLPVNVGQYTGYYVRNEANVAPLKAAVQTVVSGFESRNPDLNTLYIRYVNSGYSNVAGVETEQYQFAANQTLTVYNPAQVVEKITSFDNSSGFSNTDTVVIQSALKIQNSTGGTTFSNNFYVNDYINNGTANVQIVEIDTTTNTSVVILRTKPRAADLKAANSLLWTIEANDTIQSTNAAPSDVATVVGLQGTGATALMRTGAAGEIDTITVTNKGQNYAVLPTVSISSTGATTSQITQANLVPQTYLTKITVGNTAVSPVGNGYAVSVGKGVIYQKGHFLRVNEHLVIVEKYSNTPDAKSVGFDTSESVVTSSQDTTLLDNATGQPNATAPGANRLKLTPTLLVQDKSLADANTDFLSIIEFSGGNPFRQQRQTVYNIIGNEMARRTYEESGDYVLNQFLLNTKAAANLSAESTSFKVVVDPGQAYVRGKRVETVTNFETSVDKGTDTFIANNVAVSLNYGDYVRVSELGGVFEFDIGAQVSLYDTAATYLTSGTPGAAPTSSGSSLGTARIRSLVHESGIPGTPAAVYRLYLFDIQINGGKNFSNVRSIFYNGTNKGVADIVLENGKAALKDTNLSSLLNFAGRPAVKTGNNFSYIYRTIDDTGGIKLATNGIITFAASGSETFPYTASATLSTDQENDLVIVPLANVDVATNTAGSISVNTTSAQVNGTSTSFTTEYEPGDFIRAVNTTSNGVIGQVQSIANDTVLTLIANGTGNITSSNAQITFPAYAPISLNRATRTANVDVNSNTLTVDISATVTAETDLSVAYNVKSSNTTPVVKTVKRDRYIRIDTSNNTSSNTGPWCLGVPDVFRLKGVYLGSNNTFASGDSGVLDITNDFYIDHNQTEDYYGISYLYLNPQTTRTLTATDNLLVEFDHFTDSGEGLKAPGAAGSYAIDDSLALASSPSSINTLEIPEVYGTGGSYYDLRDYFDFRPQSANTVTANATPASAPINPVEPSAAARFTATDKKFPAPESTLTGTLEYYLGRVDRVIVDENGGFSVIRGAPGSMVPPPSPNTALTINTLTIPPYPSHPYALSAQTVSFADRRIASENKSIRRLATFRVITPIGADTRRELQPRGYKMTDIGKLERRIRDLEYYTLLNRSEIQAQSRNIPSSSNNQINRYKFGYYVDNFDNYKFAQTDNPAFSATIVNGRLSPQYEELNFPASAVQSSNNVTLPYIEKTIISQLQATDGPLVVNTVSNTVSNTASNTASNTGSTSNTTSNTSNTTSSTNTSTGSVVVTPVSNTETSNTEVVQTEVCVTQSQKSLARSDSGAVWEEFFYTMSETDGPVEFYLNARDNNMALEVFQSTSQSGSWSSILTSAAPTAQAITQSDIYARNLSPLNGYRRIEHLGSLNRKGYGPVGGFIEDQFKASWTHDASNGMYYKIRIYKGLNHGSDGQTGTFGYKLCYPSDSTVNAQSPTTGFANTIGYTTFYNGSYLIGVVDKIDISYDETGGMSFNIDSTNSSSTIDPTLSEQSFQVVATGLRPNTIHTLTVDGTNFGSKAKPAGGVIGDPLRSDSNGRLEFIFYYYPDVEPTSDVSTTAATQGSVAGTKSLVLTSADGQSTATTTITVETYANTTSGGSDITGAIAELESQGADVIYSYDELNKLYEYSKAMYPTLY